MKTLFSTKQLHPRDRFDCWHEVACKTIVNHESRPHSRLCFQAEIKAGALAQSALVLCENSPLEIVHSLDHVAGAESDDLFFCRQMSGSLILSQGSRDARLMAGDMTLIDPMLPYTGRLMAGSKVLLVKFQRRSLEARTGKTAGLTAVPMRSDKAEHGLTSSFIAMLPEYAGLMSGRSQEVVQDQALDLVALSLAKFTEGQVRLSTGRALLLLNIRCAVESRLSNPDLNVNAAAAGVSARYANLLLASEGMSLTRLIRLRRLSRCLDALKDPLQSHRPVSEIAYSWGFSDITHFGRVFKARYGLTPLERIQLKPGYNRKLRSSCCIRGA
jgi:AraC family transcriptional regulator, positive regulator of tynA and feaB